VYLLGPYCCVCVCVCVCGALFGSLRFMFFTSCIVLWDEVKREWSKLHIEELSDLYYLPNNVRLVKSRRMIWAGHGARMREVCTGFWW
jgi:hypothetical protein